MFRSRFVLVACSMAIALTLPCVSIAQDTKAEDQKTEGGSIGGFKLKPNVVVEDKMDDETLTAKVSYFMGYNLIKTMKQQGKEVDTAQMFEGMKAAAQGPDKKSFIEGYQLMLNLKKQGADLELKNLFDGMTSATEGKELDMSEEQIRAMMMTFGKLVEKRSIEKMKKEAEANVAASDAFMAKNAAGNPKVKKLDNGVQYEVLVEGTGASPTREDKVKIHYHGTFLDGKVFDSSIKPRRGGPPSPVELVAGNFVPGFTSCLVEMKVGSKWKVVIPGSLAYGVAGRGEIGPNQALQFEIELLDVMKKE